MYLFLFVSYIYVRTVSINSVMETEKWEISRLFLRILHMLISSSYHLKARPIEEEAQQLVLSPKILPISKSRRIFLVQIRIRKRRPRNNN